MKNFGQIMPRECELVSINTSSLRTQGPIPRDLSVADILPTPTAAAYGSPRPVRNCALGGDDGGGVTRRRIQSRAMISRSPS
jgi:hypothetical protein